MCLSREKNSCTYFLSSYHIFQSPFVSLVIRYPKMNSPLNHYISFLLEISKLSDPPFNLTFEMADFIFEFLIWGLCSHHFFRFITPYFHYTGILESVFISIEILFFNFLLFPLHTFLSVILYF